MPPKLNPRDREILFALPFDSWKDTLATLHMWTQIVGKVRLELCPLVNHWWNVTFYVTARGLTTSTMPFAAADVEVSFDFIDHKLLIQTCDGGTRVLALRPQSVADFYREFMAALAELGVEVNILTKPQEVPDPIPFEQDTVHASYDAEAVHRFWRILVWVDEVFKEFRAGFIGKVSPVHFFWGSFDLAAARYSGASPREEFSIGWWPSCEPPGPSFYAYTLPEPDGIRSARVRPAEAAFDEHLGEFILPYEVVASAPDPDAMAHEFFQSTYEAGADLGNWDRAALETHPSPRRPPVEPPSAVVPETPPDSREAAPREGSTGPVHRHGAHQTPRPKA